MTVAKKKISKKGKARKVVTKKDILKEAKKLGLFVYNKSLSRYEINVHVNDYEKL